MIARNIAGLEGEKECLQNWSGKPRVQIIWDTYIYIYIYIYMGQDNMKLVVEKYILKDISWIKLAYDMISWRFLWKLSGKLDYIKR